jgi:hypothetical protein
MAETITSSDRGMLVKHMADVEATLLARAQIAGNAGHTVHRGTPREYFVKEFLEGHLSVRAAVGTGEIIDANSLPREKRNQFDLVIYDADYPRINMEGGITAFLAESVLATIEVKSLLTKEDLKIAVESAVRAKKLQRRFITSFISGYVPPGILSYVVAYDGPAHATTFFKWLTEIEDELKLNQKALPPTGRERAAILSESIEGLFVLGKGSMVFDSGIGVVTDTERAGNPTGRFQAFDSPDGNLFWLFILLTRLTSNMRGQWPDLMPYLLTARFPRARFGP